MIAELMVALYIGLGFGGGCPADIDAIQNCSDVYVIEAVEDLGVTGMAKTSGGVWLEGKHARDFKVGDVVRVSYGEAFDDIKGVDVIEAD